jgi:hypothetical protein
MELQDIYKLPVTGITNAALQKKLSFGVYAPPKYVDPNAWMKNAPVIFTVCGTGVPGDFGPDADLGRVLHNEHRAQWWWIAYPATPVPMWPSIQAGLNELGRIVNLPENQNRPFYLAGYSQGAVVTSLFYMLYVKGKDLEKRFRGAVTWGNPMREKGFAYPDGVLPVPDAGNSGILDQQIVGTPSNWRDYAHQGDMYTDCGFDQNGGNKRAICKMIMGHNVFSGSDSIIAQLLEIGQNPFGNGLALFMSLRDAGMFFVVKKLTPHTNYNIGPAIDFMRSIAPVVNA